MTEYETGQVECYSGHTYASEPRAVVWQGRRYEVSQVEGYWRTPDGPAFRIRSQSGERFDVYYVELDDRWTIHPLPTDEPPTTGAR